MKLAEITARRVCESCIEVAGTFADALDEGDIHATQAKVTKHAKKKEDRFGELKLSRKAYRLKWDFFRTSSVI